MLTTLEVMSLIRKKRGTLCSYVRRGIIPALRLPDNSYLFDPHQLADWMEARMSGCLR